MKTNQIRVPEYSGNPSAYPGEVQTIATINHVDLKVINDKYCEMVPVKPICEMLGIAFEGQFTKIKNDEIMSSTVTLSVMVGADGKDREMICLPIQYVFGWLFTLKNICKVKNFVYICLAKLHDMCPRASVNAQNHWAFFMPLYNGCIISSVFSFRAKSCSLATGNVQPFFCTIS